MNEISEAVKQLSALRDFLLDEQDNVEVPTEIDLEDRRLIRALGVVLEELARREAKWQPPEWLNEGWIAADKYGHVWEWYWYDREPVLSNESNVWRNNGGACRLLQDAFQIDFPTVTSARDSLHRIPPRSERT